MVNARAIFVAVLASGCLGKPALGVDAGHDDALSGEVDAPVGAPGCTGRTAFPAGLVLRGAATVGDLDRRTGGDAADDIVVWGRENGTGAAHVYLMSGHPEMTATCYDERFDFLHDAVDPIDVWIGETTGDSHPDMLMLATEDAGMVTEIILRAGDGATGLPSAEVTSTTIPTTDNRFQAPWGGTLTSYLPEFLTAWQATPTTPGRIFAGGLYYNPASIQVLTQSGHATFGPVLAAEANGDTHLTESAVQDVYIHGGAPEQPIMITQDQVFRVSHVSDGGTTATYALHGLTSPPGGSAQRGVRFARHPVNGGSLGLMYDGNSGLQAIQVIGVAEEQAVFHQLEGPTVFPLDFEIGALDGDARPDVAILHADIAGNSTLLSVYPNLTVSPYSVGSVQSISIPAGYTTLAVGDFDGNPATPDQILVLSKTIGDVAARCYELLPSCLAVCGGHC